MASSRSTFSWSNTNSSTFSWSILSCSSRGPSSLSTYLLHRLDRSRRYRHSLMFAFAHSSSKNRLFRALPSLGFQNKVGRYRCKSQHYCYMHSYVYIEARTLSTFRCEYIDGKRRVRGQGFNTPSIFCARPG
jgi:hypothetical protein